MYRDALNNEITSDPLKVEVQVVPAGSPGLTGILALIVIIGLLAGCGYWYYARRARQQ